MNKRQLIRKTEEFVKKTIKGDPGHDWSHADRVRKLALYIAKKEKADQFIVELAAILHDVADWKFNRDPQRGVKISRSWLEKNKVDKRIIDEVCYIVDNSGWHKKIKIRTVEGHIVKDADMLDALGAIGIARTFSFGGYFRRPLHLSNVKPSLKRRRRTSTINHFYEKLLHLKDRMHTNTAKRIAAERHQIMLEYLKEFYKEWEGLK